MMSIQEREELDFDPTSMAREAYRLESDLLSRQDAYEDWLEAQKWANISITWSGCKLEPRLFDAYGEVNLTF